MRFIVTIHRGAVVLPPMTIGEYRAFLMAHPTTAHAVRPIRVVQ